MKGIHYEFLASFSLRSISFLVFLKKNNEIDNNNLIEDKDIFIKEVSKKAYRYRLIILYIVISLINLPNIGKKIQDQYLN